MTFNNNLIAIFIGLALLSTPAISHGRASGPTLERMNAMSDIQKTLKRLKPALENASANNVEIEKAFDELRTFGSALSTLFEENHMIEMSEALPKIWSSPETFAVEIEFYNMQIDKAAATNDPRLAMREISKGCQSCHTQFREKKQ